jgi:hypothetical protein
MATDLPSVDVKWRERSGAEQELYFNFGCDMARKREMVDGLSSARSLLPIDSFVR